MIGNVVRGGLTGLVGMLLLATLGSASSAHAQDVPPATDPAAVEPAPAPATTVPDGPPPLIPVPVGCPEPEPAAVAFVGTMTGKDDVTQTVRFRIDQLRAGSAGPWAIDGLIDVRYGTDYRFLDEGDQYLVGAGFDPVHGVLSSSVRPAAPDFGGNDVVGVDDSAVECPTLDDPVRTVHVDGSDVDSGVMSLLFADRRLLLATIGVPAALAFATLLVLVVLKTFSVLAMRGVLELGRAAVTPVPDHRAVRIRRHRPTPPAHGEPTPEPAGSDAAGTEATNHDSPVS